MKIQTLWFAALAALMMVALPLSRGEARTLEEILKDKGVITAEDYAEATKVGLGSYQPGKGFVAASADGNSRMHIGGYAQLLYKYTAVDNSARDDISDFDIRRFKLVVDGNVFSKDFGYKFQGDLKDGFITEDAFINYKFASPLVVQLGQFKPPQARQELTSAARQLFPERSLANDTFNLGRDQGVQASGSFADKLIEYRLGIFNGNGPNASNPDDNHMIAGRIDFNPHGPYKMDEAAWPSEKPLVNFGVSFAWEKLTAADVGNNFNNDNDVLDVALNLDELDAAGFNIAFGNDLTWLLWTGNLNATWKGVVFAAEFYNLTADPAAAADFEADGHYVQAGYQVIPNELELGVRYSAVESTDANASARFDRSQTQFGANYYFIQHNLKVQSDLTFAKDDLAANRDDTIFRLQAQFYY